MLFRSGSLGVVDVMVATYDTAGVGDNINDNMKDETYINVVVYYIILQETGITII
jgi:hypothetical protein